MSIPSILFDPADLPPAVKYEKLFDNLPKLQECIAKTGRYPFSRNSLLKALIYKALRRLVGLSDLNFELNNNPCVANVLGFNPLAPAPSVERFSSFLRDIQNTELKTIHQQLMKTLIDLKVVSGNSIAIDSCPIVVPLKENNLKTSMPNRFDKTRRPAGDPDARLGVMIHYPTPFKRKVRYFWGYRNHVIVDTDTELPLWEITKPADVHETRLAKTLLAAAKHCFGLNSKFVLGDATFDTEDFLRFIIEELGAQPIIPRNPRRSQHPKGYHVKKDKVICEAGLQMYRRGRMRPKNTGILYRQYSCPIVYDKKTRAQFIMCPIFHHKFFNGKGCNALIRLEPSIRDEIDYDTEKFKELYATRTSVERIFSRLLSIAMQKPTMRGLHAIQNYVTIAHITVTLVALTAYKAGQKDKIRFVKSFVPNFLKDY
jgi:hypothetical protein